ncbi:MAG: transposase family protein [Flavobacteriales bacterium]|nr:transposase family protein [Flavobacteriales bacterium]
MEDNRRLSGNKQHELLDVVAISICGVICGADSWDGIRQYGREKEKWLTLFYFVLCLAVFLLTILLMGLSDLCVWRNFSRALAIVYRKIT